jgi:TusE/DsrC/DsvC family sulfur relay protein
VSARNNEHQSDLERSVRVIAGREIVFDKDGFFMHFEDWSEEVFECLARESGLSDVGDVHWLVIRFLRSFYAYNRRAPLHR